MPLLTASFTLPPETPLNFAQFKAVEARLLYLEPRYDHTRSFDQLENLFTGAMSDPANLLSDDEIKERDSLGAVYSYNLRTGHPFDPLADSPGAQSADAAAANLLGALGVLVASASGASPETQAKIGQIGAALGDAALARGGARLDAERPGLPPRQVRAPLEQLRPNGAPQIVEDVAALRTPAPNAASKLPPSPLNPPGSPIRSEIADRGSVSSASSSSATAEDAQRNEPPSPAAKRPSNAPNTGAPVPPARSFVTYDEKFGLPAPATDTGLGPTAVNNGSPLSQVQINAQNGADFAAGVTNYVRDEFGSTIEEEVSVRPFIDPDGTLASFRVRLDQFGLDEDTGNFVLFDAKSSETAPLTPNQTIGYPSLGRYGGQVVGNAGGRTSLPVRLFRLHQFR
jgi:hypothetical protein